MSFIESEPCAEQRQVMESLGFTAEDTEERNKVPWVRVIEAWETHTFTVTLKRDQKPSIQQMADILIKTAFESGQRHRSKAFSKLLQDQ